MSEQHTSSIISDFLRNLPELPEGESPDGDNDKLGLRTFDRAALVQQPTTISVIIIDRSGSMRKFRQTVINCIGDHFQQIKNCADGRQHYCLVVSFADDWQVEMPLSAAADAKMERYQPNGFTLLYETVDQVLGKLLGFAGQLTPEQAKNLKVVVGVFSDGEDNRSNKSGYPRSLQQTAKIALEQNNFMLLTFGIGINATELAEKTGFSQDDEHAVTVSATSEGITLATGSFTNSTLL